MSLQNDEKWNIKGSWRIDVHNEDGSLADSRSGTNVMCNKGMWLIAQFFASSLFVGSGASQLTPTPIGNIQLALGTSSVAPQPTDSFLNAEYSNGSFIARSVLTGTLVTPATQSLSVAPAFSFFGMLTFPPIAWTCYEGGVFLNGDSPPAINTGAILDHFLVSPPVTQNTNQTLTINVTFQL